MDVDDHTNAAMSALWDGKRSPDFETKQAATGAAQVHALLAVAAAIRELAEATRANRQSD